MYEYQKATRNINYFGEKDFYDDNDCSCECDMHFKFTQYLDTSHVCIYISTERILYIINYVYINTKDKLSKLYGMVQFNSITKSTNTFIYSE